MAQKKTRMKRLRGSSPIASKTELKNRKRDVLPEWDKKLRQLWLGDTLVKQFHHSAKIAELILDAFQEQNWTSHIDDPLPPIDGRKESRRLRDELHSLNGRLDERLIQFYMDGTGKGICWKRRKEE